MELPYTPEDVAAVARMCAYPADAYYEILGVRPEADFVEMKKSFMKLVKEVHPDKNHAPGAGDAMKVLGQAWEVLVDPTKRAAYDRQRNRGTAANDQPDDSDDSDYEEPSYEFLPRTPPEGETRKQRRQREFEERKARLEAKEDAERRARKRERERVRRRRREKRMLDDLCRLYTLLHIPFFRDRYGVHIERF
ncbi:DnaJ-domain-containing protein [Auricularia subglabra TFB-10046 SS5]|nr:DnaJ-domain-containing protein [Auricularia subglabra TFB-10046 SS5]